MHTDDTHEMLHLNERYSCIAIFRIFTKSLRRPAADHCANDIYDHFGLGSRVIFFCCSHNLIYVRLALKIHIYAYAKQFTLQVHTTYSNTK